LANKRLAGVNPNRITFTSNLKRQKPSANALGFYLYQYKLNT